MPDDLEISTMSQISEILSKLEPAAVARVLRWAADKYGVGAIRPAKLSKGSIMSPGNEDIEGEFKDVAELYSAANPSTDAERALIVGYWFQQIKGQDALDAQQINTVLKNLGHGITNITAAMTDLKQRKPSLAIQIQKKGKTKQARKKYKLTAAGLQKVNKMISGQAPEEEASNA